MKCGLCLLDTTVRCTKMAEQSTCCLGYGTPVGQRNHILEPLKGKTQFWGHLPAHCKIQGISGVQFIFSTLFGGGGQQQCDLSLSVLEQLVVIKYKSLLWASGSGIAAGVVTFTAGRHERWSPPQSVCRLQWHKSSLLASLVSLMQGHHSDSTNS